MTSFHIFKSIFNSSFEFYGLSEWLLERMPDNVDLNRYNTIRSTNNGWIFQRHNARSKFICSYCTKFNQKKFINGWSSAYTTILFRVRLDRSHHGQHIGRIQMKIFEQGCQLCNTYSTGIFDETEIKKTFYRLYIWILKTFYNIKLIDDEIEEVYDLSQGQNPGQYPHDSNRCDGCRVDGSCLTFNYQHENDNINDCSIVQSNQGYKICFVCYINRIMTSSDNITLNQSCSPIPNNHCVDLHFNTTILYKNFSQQYSNLINKLFANENNQIVNSLNIHIKYDIHNEFSFDTFQILDHILNRNYHVVSFELKNRDHRLTLPLNNDIKNLTLNALQINIYCGRNGLFQYNYLYHQRESLVKSLTCEIPTTTTTTRTMNITSTKKTQSQSILFFSLIGSGSLIPCLIVIFCLYILCKQHYEKTIFNNEQRESFTSSIVDSISS